MPALRPAGQPASRQASEAQDQGTSLVRSLRAADAKATGRDAWNTARRYTRNAGGVAGEKVGDLKVKAGDFQETAARRIADEPLKAVAIGAAAGALLAAIFMRRGRDKRNY